MNTTAWMRTMWLVGTVYVATTSLACDDDEVGGQANDAGTTTDSKSDSTTDTATDALGSSDTRVSTDALGGSDTLTPNDALGDADALSDSDANATTDALFDSDAGSPTDALGDTMSDSGSEPLRARATLGATSDGGTIQGVADFVELNGMLTATVIVTGATPGPHGLHIHQNGSCDATDAGPGTAAGGHWNPTDASHGYPDATSHHVGDFGNIEIGADGTGSLTLVLEGLTLREGAQSVLNRAVIFHAGADDGISQPTGNSGARPACGIIALIP